MPSSSPTTPDRCVPKRRGQTISLPVLPTDPARARGAAGGGGGGRNAWEGGHATIKHSRVGKWRAAVLILVHVAMAVHILLWLKHGRTVSPVEPSESMQTLREGLVNAGFVFFALAILSTLVLGRWFCGWGCHMVAVQDFCGWLMMKMGVKPRQFRSRLLVFVPLALALYMFVLPVFHREVLRPLVMDAAGKMPAWLGQSDPLPGVTTRFMVTNFWETFAVWYWAIPFLIVCTFGAVYFLGAKGFCTYGCPYGGFFAPAEKLSVGRIRVTDACNGCGHCTAVCTSNVRVHEEVRDFGMVVDPGCMKCMDCVSVCPNEALYFGLGRPGILATLKNDAAKVTRAQAKALKAARYDLKWWEEIAAVVLFVAYFWCYRSMFNQVPMLMAVALAGIMVFCTWKLWQMRPVSLGGQANMRFQNWQVRYRGRLKTPGVLLAVGTVLMMAMAIWGGAVRVTLAKAAFTFDRLRTPPDVVLKPEFQPTPAEARDAKLLWERYTAAGALGSKDPLGAPGVASFGWGLAPDPELQISYAHLLLGDAEAALARLDRIIDQGRPLDNLVFQAGQIIQSRSIAAARTQEELIAAQQRGSAKTIELYRKALKKHPGLDGVRAVLADYIVRSGDNSPQAREEARTLLNEAMDDRPLRARSVLNLGRLELTDPDAAAVNKLPELVDRALASEPKDDAAIDQEAAGLLLQAAGRLDGAGRASMIERATGLAERALAKAGRLGDMELTIADFYAAIGNTSRAAELANRGLEKARKLGPHTGFSQTVLSAANLHARMGHHKEALSLFQEAAKPLKLSRHAAWSLYNIGQATMALALDPNGGNRIYLPEAVAALEAARDDEPDSCVIRYALAMSYYASQRMNDAVREMTAAATLGDRNVFLAQRLSGLLAEAGRPEESMQWDKAAAQREAARVK